VDDEEEELSKQIVGNRPAMLGGGFPPGERIRALEEGFQYHREQIHAANNRLHKLGNTVNGFTNSVNELENKLERFERVQHDLDESVKALQGVNKSLSEKEAARQRRRDDVKSVAAIVAFVLSTLIGVSTLFSWLRDATPGP
jgi:DNA repair exonuclease SbcCD ATPase subunit